MNKQTKTTETEIQNAEPADAAAFNETLAAENTALRERIARLSLEQRLERSGARSPALLSRSVADLPLSDSGDLVNAGEIVEKLKREMPEQFVVEKRTENQIDAGTGTRSNAAVITREMLEQMPAERIAELDWDTVKRVLSGN